MAGEATVGSILGYLRLDRSDWDRELQAAGAKADELGRHNPNIRIGTNAPSAIAQLSAVAAATKRLQDAQGAEAVAEARLQSLRDRGITDAGRLSAAEEAVAKARRSQAAAVIALAAAQDVEHAASARVASDTESVGKAADKAKLPVVSLVGALAAISPAAVPIGAVAGGALLGLLPVAATVALGIKGIENAMKSAATQGGAFGQSIATLKGDLGTLENTAASGLMVGINKALAGSQPLFQTVNGDIAVMSGQLGDIVAGAAPALLRILTDLNPLFVTFGQLLTAGAGKLEHWATSSGGVQSFVGYVQHELPIVMDLFGHLAVLFGHVVQAAAPIGDTVLHVLNALATALDAVPVPVLTDLGYAFVALYPVVKLVGVFNAISASLTKLGVESAGAKLGLGAATLGFAAAGYGLDVLGHKISGAIESGNTFAATTDNLTKQAQSWSQALLANNGVLDQNTRLQVALALQQNGVAAAGAKAGISLGQLTDIVVGNTKITKEQFKALGSSNVALAFMEAQYGDTAKAAKAAAAASQLQAAKVKAATAATKENTTATQVVADTTSQYATALVKVNTALQTYYDTVLGNAQTEDQFLIGLKQVGSQINTNGVSLSQHTLKGLQNRDMLISNLQAAENAAKGSKDYTGALEGNVAQFEQAAIHAGFSKTAVQKLIEQMHLTPKDIETRFNADITPAMRALQSLNAYIATHTPHVTVEVSASGTKGEYIPGEGYVIKKAAGGPVNGPGARGVDSVPALLAPGEFVMNNRAVDKYGLGFMRAMNAGTLQMPTMTVPSSAASGSGPISVRVFVGNQEIRDITRVEVNGQLANVGRSLPRQGARSGAGGW